MPIAKSCGLVPTKLQPSQQLLREVAAHAVAKIVTFARMSTPGSKRRLLLAVLVDAAIAGADADDRLAVAAAPPRRENR